MSSKLKQKGYQIIEPPIHEKLNWDMNLIVKCLEYIRNEIPIKFDNFPKTIEYDLLAMENFLDNIYPVIGMYSRNENDFKNVPDFLELFDLVENWIDEIGLENIKQKALQIDTIDWETLKKMRSYPMRNSD